MGRNDILPDPALERTYNRLNSDCNGYHPGNTASRSRDAGGAPGTEWAGTCAGDMCSALNHSSHHCHHHNHRHHDYRSCHHDSDRNHHDYRSCHRRHHNCPRVGHLDCYVVLLNNHHSLCSHQSNRWRRQTLIIQRATERSKNRWCSLQPPDPTEDLALIKIKTL